MTGFYARLRDKKNHDTPLQECIENTTNKLESEATTSDKPGMLLGKIQSGKTGGFLGVILKAFDRDFEIALVFTKGTRTLAKQTVRRISSDYKEFIDDELISVYDIMEMPNNRLTKSELKRKIVIIAKKETRNLTRVLDLFKTGYPELASKKVLLIDDEADMASVRFVKQRGTNNYLQGTIAQQMDELRSLIRSLAFLQVTATPYALYLQPEEYSPPAGQYEFFPKKPAFTELLPIHGRYVGGDDYFGTFDETDFRYYLYVKVPDLEQAVLRVPDPQLLHTNFLENSDVAILTEAIMTFYLGVVVRRWQQKEQDEKLGKFTMIIHNDTQRRAHNFQWEVVEKIQAAFESATGSNDSKAIILFNKSYHSLSLSVKAQGGRFPDQDTALKSIKSLIEDGEVNVQKVNSDVELTPLLDSDTAELKLRTPANIFIGGSILDRGITIPNLIAFYYGRNPRTMQADTVLQHSRMYGARSHQDLAVTRFYTSSAVHDRLDEIHKLETTLRSAFESGGYANGVIFLENDATQGVIPCSPTKVAVSNLITIRPKDLLLPTNFDTIDSFSARSSACQITKKIADFNLNAEVFNVITSQQALDLIKLSQKSINIDKRNSFQWASMESLIEYYCKINTTDEVDFIFATDRALDRVNSGDKSGRSIIGTSLRSRLLGTARSKPALIFLKQKGAKSLNWEGGYEFWWPILASPTEGKPCVFANK